MYIPSFTGNNGVLSSGAGLGSQSSLPTRPEYASFATTRSFCFSSFSVANHTAAARGRDGGARESSFASLSTADNSAASQETARAATASGGDGALEGGPATGESVRPSAFTIQHASSVHKQPRGFSSPEEGSSTQLRNSAGDGSGVLRGFTPATPAPSLSLLSPGSPHTAAAPLDADQHGHVPDATTPRPTSTRASATSAGECPDNLAPPVPSPPGLQSPMMWSAPHARRQPSRKSAALASFASTLPQLTVNVESPPPSLPLPHPPSTPLARGMTRSRPGSVSNAAAMRAGLSTPKHTSSFSSRSRSSFYGAEAARESGATMRTPPAPAREWQPQATRDPPTAAGTPLEPPIAAERPSRTHRGPPTEGRSNSDDSGVNTHNDGRGCEATAAGFTALRRASGAHGGDDAALALSEAATPLELLHTAATPPEMALLPGAAPWTCPSNQPFAVPPPTKGYEDFDESVVVDAASVREPHAAVLDGRDRAPPQPPSALSGSVSSSAAAVQSSTASDRRPQSAVAAEIIAGDDKSDGGGHGGDGEVRDPPAPAALAASPPPRMSEMLSSMMKGSRRSARRFLDVQLANGRYTVKTQVGAGSFGELFWGIDASTGKEVAIKLESVKARQPQLLFESRLYRHLHARSSSFHPSISRADLRAFQTQNPLLYLGAHSSAPCQLPQPQPCQPVAQGNDGGLHGIPTVLTEDGSSVAMSELSLSGDSTNDLRARTHSWTANTATVFALMSWTGATGAAGTPLHPSATTASAVYTSSASTGPERTSSFASRHKGSARGGTPLLPSLLMPRRANSARRPPPPPPALLVPPEHTPLAAQASPPTAQHWLHAATYLNLAEVVGFPQCHHYGQEGDYNVMVMDLLGPNLEDLFSLCGRRFTLKTVCLLADQMLHRLEYLHHKGFIHRDIKPENFVMGPDPATGHIVHLIDFGLAKRYWDARANQHVPYKEGRSLTGTARYCSINAHLGTEQSRRDDLESLGYVLLYFLRKGGLPWQSTRVTGGGGGGAAEHTARNMRIAESKMATSLDSLCRDLPPQMLRYMKYCRGLQFEETPDYGACRELFAQLMDGLPGTTRDWVFDWTALAQRGPKSSAATTGEPALAKEPATDSSPNAKVPAWNGSGDAGARDSGACDPRHGTPRSRGGARRARSDGTGGSEVDDRKRTDRSRAPAYAAGSPQLPRPSPSEFAVSPRDGSTRSATSAIAHALPQRPFMGSAPSTVSMRPLQVVQGRPASTPCEQSSGTDVGSDFSGSLRNASSRPLLGLSGGLPTRLGAASPLSTAARAASVQRVAPPPSFRLSPAQRATMNTFSVPKRVPAIEESGTVTVTTEAFPSRGISPPMNFF